MAIIEVYQDDRDVPIRFDFPDDSDFSARLDVVLVQLFGRQVADSRVTRSEGETTAGLCYWSGTIGRHTYTVIEADSVG
ncbi:hypothetical protein E3T54_11905 [Cryobacterium sp. Sr8]|uniref:hypothetical protein n=1 Tax=Cryobacterium sp. Sr8 TaxID=1259203 RepID=UPI00106CDAFF|nr:hypothetical protein [Cryobacterium sp. Sr8]TFD75430.1 hypothetical protein E3T54_11905 [Cryobacterium sp. Sr8]